MHFSSLFRVSGPTQPVSTSSEPSLASEEISRSMSIMYQNLDPHSTFGTKIEAPDCITAVTTNTNPNESFTYPTPQSESERFRSTFSDKFRRVKCAFRRSSGLSNFLKVHPWRTVVSGYEKPRKELSKNRSRNWFRRKSPNGTKSPHTLLNAEEEQCLLHQTPTTTTTTTAAATTNATTPNTSYVSIFDTPAKKFTSMETVFTNITTKTTTQAANLISTPPSVGQPIPSTFAFIDEQLAGQTATFSSEESQTGFCEVAHRETNDEEISIKLEPTTIEELPLEEQPCSELWRSSDQSSIVSDLSLDLAFSSPLDTISLGPLLEEEQELFEPSPLDNISLGPLLEEEDVWDNISLGPLLEEELELEELEELEEEKQGQEEEQQSRDLVTEELVGEPQVWEVEQSLEAKDLPTSLDEERNVNSIDAAAAGSCSPVEGTAANAISSAALVAFDESPPSHILAFSGAKSPEPTITTDAAATSSECWQDTRRLRCYRVKCRTTEYASCAYCSSLVHVSSSLRNLATKESMEQDKSGQPISALVRPSEEHNLFLDELYSRSYDLRVESFQVQKQKDNALLGNWW